MLSQVRLASLMRFNNVSFLMCFQQWCNLTICLHDSLQNTPNKMHNWGTISNIIASQQSLIVIYIGGEWLLAGCVSWVETCGELWAGSADQETCSSCPGTTWLSHENFHISNTQVKDGEKDNCIIRDEYISYLTFSLETTAHAQNQHSLCDHFSLGPKDSEMRVLGTRLDHFLLRPESLPL